MQLCYNESKGNQSMGLDIRVKLLTHMLCHLGSDGHAMSNVIKARCLGGAQLCSRCDVRKNTLTFIPPISQPQIISLPNAACRTLSSSPQTEHGSHPNHLQPSSQNTGHLLSIFRTYENPLTYAPILFGGPVCTPNKPAVMKRPDERKIPVRMGCLREQSHIPFTQPSPTHHTG